MAYKVVYAWNQKRKWRIFLLVILHYTDVIVLEALVQTVVVRYDDE